MATLTYWFRADNKTIYWDNLLIRILLNNNVTMLCLTAERYTDVLSRMSKELTTEVGPLS